MLTEPDAVHTTTQKRLAGWAWKHGIPEEWLASAIHDAMLWLDGLDEELSGNEAANKCARLAMKIARREWLKFEHILCRQADGSWARSPYTTEPLEDNDVPDTIDMETLTAEQEVFNDLLADLNPRYRMPLLIIARHAHSLDSTQIVKEAIEISGLSATAYWQQLSRFRQKVRARLGLPKDAGWQEVRRALWL